MQKVLKAIHDKFINENIEELTAARDRADSVCTDGSTLGESVRMQIFAATQTTSLEELMEGAKIIKALKRGALIQVHNLLYYSNRYGVMTCTVPATYVFGNNFNGQWGPCITFAGGAKILERQIHMSL